ncbi:GGDEF domain-containing protein [Sneathiella chinensis]|uniref:Diguanylate cyclase DosC n=1 Tax=Sneathiella chinensis TaxID=349750 RepID=A0ABQ5U120_9PROT|nr:GGDEF domain-containing protein [Sneathiella chinensis]GLQ05004.1 sensor histidine kinase [Sneathiella chinensis]
MTQFVKTTLIEQMGYSEREIARRQHYLNFGDGDKACLAAFLDTVSPSADALVEQFYRFQLTLPEAELVIGDADTLVRLKIYMRDYVRSLFGGVYDEPYVNTRLRIGMVHKRIGVHPRIYMQAHIELQRLLEEEIKRHLTGEVREATLTALRKVLLFDAELVFDAFLETYMTEIQSITREVETYASQVGIRVDSMLNRVHQKARRDALTGLYNRRALYDFIKHESLVAERHGLSFLVAYMDLNGFKQVNDQHGHHAGDEVLVQVANALNSSTRDVDITARYGGDEFVVVMPRTTLRDAEGPLRRMTDKITRDCPYPVTVSMGVVQAGPIHIDEVEELIRKADMLMYEAKKRARVDGAHHWQYETALEDSRSAAG